LSQGTFAEWGDGDVTMAAALVEERRDVGSTAQGLSASKSSGALLGDMLMVVATQAPDDA